MTIDGGRPLDAFLIYPIVSPSATAIAVVVATIPVDELLGELSLTVHFLCVALFWLGWTTFGAMLRARGWNAVFLRLAALLLLTVSFDLNSQLVMFYAVGCCLFLFRARETAWRNLADRARAVCIRYPYFLALPVICWVWESVLTPPQGLYANYNKPSLNIPQILTGYGRVVTDFLLPVLWELCCSFECIALALVAAKFTFLLASRLGSSGTPGGAGVDDASKPARDGWWLVGGGLLSLAAAAFPCIAMGQNLESCGWGARNCVLCSLPLGLLVVGGLPRVRRLPEVRPVGGGFPARALRAPPCREAGGVQLQEARLLSVMWCAADGRDRRVAGR
jgi:hypothetical protein